MLVTRVEIRAPVTSFRYPHFLVGRQPSYEMPPLATLYGHLCAAVGEWVPVDAVRLGLRFQYAGRADDLEHQVIINQAGGKMPDGSHPRTTEGIVQPTLREFLFDARLTLYVSGDWTTAFRAPRYAAGLGRSQDLVSYEEVRVVELQPSPEVYYEYTLLPWRLRPAVLRGRAETMARWIDYANGRRPYFDRFLIVQDSVATNSPLDWIRRPDSPATHWSDPEAPLSGELPRGVWMHPLAESES